MSRDENGRHNTADSKSHWRCCLCSCSSMSSTTVTETNVSEFLAQGNYIKAPITATQTYYQQGPGCIHSIESLKPTELWHPTHTVHTHTHTHTGTHAPMHGIPSFALFVHVYVWHHCMYGLMCFHTHDPAT